MKISLEKRKLGELIPVQLTTYRHLCIMSDGSRHFVDREDILNTGWCDEKNLYLIEYNEPLPTYKEKYKTVKELSVETKTVYINPKQIVSQSIIQTTIKNYNVKITKKSSWISAAKWELIEA